MANESNLFMSELELGNQPLLNHKDQVQFNELQLKDDPQDSKPKDYTPLFFGILGGIGLIAISVLIYLLVRSHNASDVPATPEVLKTQKKLYTNSNLAFANFTDLPGCDVYKSPDCPSASGEMLPGWDSHMWNTPPRGSKEWQNGFQDMNVLTGYAQLKYSGDRKSCTINVITRTSKNLQLSYSFNGQKQSGNSKTFSSSFSGIVNVVVEASSGEKLELEDVDFIWNMGPLKSRPGDFRNGQKGAVVELFGWPDDQIELECKDIADSGYLGVKLFPHMEQVMSWQPQEGQLNPWYFMYQPVSYSLNGRMGSRAQLRKMIRTCRSYGLRVYADAVVNHMSGNGNDLNYHRNPGAGCASWPPKVSSGALQDRGSPYYTPAWTYKTNPYTGRGTDALEYPAVPYGPKDFHCAKPCNSWNDPNNLNTGWLVGLTDLDTSKDYVRQRIADHFVDLLSIGFTGFRVDAAKHIHPRDLAVIFAKLKAGLGGSYPEDFFTWLEVLPGGESQLLLRDSEYSYTTYFANQMKSNGLSDKEIVQIKIWWAGYPQEPELDEGRLPRSRKVIQNDDHDQQSSGSSSRSLGDKGCVLVMGCDHNAHRNYEKRLFTSPYPGYGVDNDNDYPIRMILSSYYFKDGNQSPPDGYSDCSKCTITCQGCRSRARANAHAPGARGYDGSDYTRVHRDSEIIKAVRQWMHLA